MLEGATAPATSSRLSANCAVSAESGKSAMRRSPCIPLPSGLTVTPLY
jgi:hypothetical protein